MASDSGSNTPVQTDSNDTSSPTTLTSLPTELIAAIGRHLAPDGGRKAGDLRLVSRALDRAVAPVVWASLAVPTTVESLDQFFSAILDEDLKALTSSICSISLAVETPLLATSASFLISLKSLRRLEVYSQEHYGSRERPRLPPILVKTISRLRTLEDIQLSSLDLGDLEPLTSWAPPSVRRFAMVDCQALSKIFTDERHGILQLPSMSSLLFQADKPPTHDVILLARVASVACGNLELEIDFCDTNDRHLAYLASSASSEHATDWSSHEGPLRVQLKNLFLLFSSKDPELRPGTTAFVVLLLNWVGVVTELELPVLEEFDVQDRFGALALPRLKALALQTGEADDWRRSPVAIDLLTDSSYRNLIKLLDTASLPSLATLRLRGWLDATNVKTIALAAPGVLPRKHLEVYGLLGTLLTTGVTELRLQNSIGHPDELEECVFWRADRDAQEWQKRLATFW